MPVLGRHPNNHRTLFHPSDGLRARCTPRLSNCFKIDLRITVFKQAEKKEGDKALEQEYKSNEFNRHQRTPSRTVSIFLKHMQNLLQNRPKVGHITSLSRLKRIEVILIMFSLNHIKLEINNRNKFRKFTDT